MSKSPRARDETDTGGNDEIGTGRVGRRTPYREFANGGTCPESWKRPLLGESGRLLVQP